MRQALVNGVDRLPSSRLALATLVGANTVPVVLVLSSGWTVYEVVLFYWVENGVIGLLNVPKILLASDGGVSTESSTPLSMADISVGNVVSVAFFLFHYGLFWLVHGLFVLALFGRGSDELLSPVPVTVAAVSMFVSHGVSLWDNYLGRGEYRAVTGKRQMFRPYRRVVVLHVTVIFGGFAVAVVGGPLGALLVLIGLKTAFDVVSHLRDHAATGSTA